MYRHELLEQMLRLIGVEEENIYQDVEGIEHHLSWNSIDRIGDLVNILKGRHNVLKIYELFKKEMKKVQNKFAKRGLFFYYF